MGHRYEVFTPQINPDCIEVSAKNKAEAIEKARKIWMEGTKDFMESFEFVVEDDVQVMQRKKR